MPTLERLHSHLQSLTLAEADAVLEAHLERAAQEQRPYSDFLVDLLQAEYDARRVRRISTRLNLAHLPYRKTLAQFDLGFQPSIDKRQIKDLQNLRLLHEANNVIFLGLPGGLLRSRQLRGQPLERWRCVGSIGLHSASHASLRQATQRMGRTRRPWQRRRGRLRRLTWALARPLCTCLPPTMLGTEEVCRLPSQRTAPGPGYGVALGTRPAGRVAGLHVTSSPDHGRP
jgi:hypothetical protein